MFESSQTYIGVLTTLVALCLFHDSNNFIISFVINLKDETRKIFDDAIINISKKIDDTFWKDDADKKNYKFFSSVSSASQPKLQQDLFKISQKAQMVSAKLMTECKNIIDKGNEQLCKVEKSKDVVFAALYVFLYCIVVLFVDACLCSKYKLFSYVFVYAFTLVSNGFLFFIWVNFWSSTKAEIDQNRMKPPKKKYIGLLIIFFIFLILTLFFVPYCNVIFDIDSLLLFFCFLIILTFILSLLKRKYYTYIKYTNFYNRQFIISHFLYLFLFSIVTTLIFISILFLFKDNRCSFDMLNMFYTHIDCNNINLVVTILVTLNAVILPILLSYIRYIIIKLGISRKIELKRNDSNEEISRLKNEYDQVISDIKNSFLNNH